MTRERSGASQPLGLGPDTELDPARGERVLAVSELIEELRGALADGFDEVYVEGELASLHHSRAGHFYFVLKDDRAQLQTALFRSAAASLSFALEEGRLVRVRGRLDVYRERGRLQLIAAELSPCGEGALRRAFERLRDRLLAEGLFDPAHRKPLPFLPRRIGLVTSLQGAAVHDFSRGLRRRFPGAEVLVWDARVQGEGAWRELVRGLHLLDAIEDVDVLVLTRGGGSLEDLWAFNREELVRAIFELETPLVSAVGHDVDVVLTDFVADQRAATPTHAAELVVPDAARLRQRVRELDARLVRRQRSVLELFAQRLEALRRGLVHPAQRLAELGRRLTVACERLQRAGRSRREHAEARLEARSRRLRAAVHRVHEVSAARLGALGGRLDALSPLAVLGRGYALARRVSDGAILRSNEQVAVDERIEVLLARGRLLAAVLETLKG
ncbi:MAG: exodeoxyribonuclease VII large subunit [Myxococcota bacterium]